MSNNTSNNSEDLKVGREQFEKYVFPEELSEITARREWIRIKGILRILEDISKSCSKLGKVGNLCQEAVEKEKAKWEHIFLSDLKNIIECCRSLVEQADKESIPLKYLTEFKNFCTGVVSQAEAQRENVLDQDLEDIDKHHQTAISKEISEGESSFLKALEEIIKHCEELMQKARNAKISLIHIKSFQLLCRTTMEDVKNKRPDACYRFLENEGIEKLWQEAIEKEKNEGGNALDIDLEDFQKLCQEALTKEKAKEKHALRRILGNIEKLCQEAIEKEKATRKYNLNEDIEKAYKLFLETVKKKKDEEKSYSYEDIEGIERLFKEVLNRISDRKTQKFPDLNDRPDDAPEFSKKFQEEVIDKIKDNKQKELWGKAKHPGLVGLALSGGGIRSATFNLGILQALDKCGILDKIDYMSTVSGGGYIGSCLSSIASGNSPSNVMSHFPFRHQQGKPENSAFLKLRNNAKYLAPKGYLDALSMPFLILRGAAIHFLILLPIILIATIITVSILSSRADLQATLFLPNLPLWSYFPFPSFCWNTLFFIPLIIILYLHRYADKYRVLWWSVLLPLAILLILEWQQWAIQFFNRSFLEVMFESGIDWKETLEEYWALVGAIGAIIGTLFSGKITRRLNELKGKIVLNLVGSLAFIILYLLYLKLCQIAIVDAPFTFNNQMQAKILSGYLLLALGLFVFWFCYNANWTSLHTFYKDRLSAAYSFFVVSPSADAIDNSELILSNLNVIDAPYLLINAAVNLKDLQQAYQKERKADFFILSKMYIGGHSTQYRKTGEIESIQPDLTLASARAISGAAAAANMGVHTMGSFRFMLALLNVRLSYWLPNPAKHLPKGKPGVFYLFREMFGYLNRNHDQVNLSDGGHIENLGIFELLRRECRLIIAGDGEADNSLDFPGLSTLIRMAQIDLGIKITMNGLQDIKLGTEQFAIGTIYYSGGRQGKLIYLKSSLRKAWKLLADQNGEGKETNIPSYDKNSYIANYHMKNRDFPHESTADQHFDESQFECYRALGYKVGMRAFT